MTQEEKAKAYDKALERAKIWKDKSGMPKDKQGILDDIFPELAESEDELVWLTKYIEEEAYYLSMDIRDNEDRIKLKNLQKSLAWLEKQGDKPQGKSALEAINEVKVDNQNCVKPADFKAEHFYVSKVDGQIHDMTYNPAEKVEPKFHEGEWCVDHNGKIAIIYDLQKAGYVGHYIDGTDFVCKYSDEHLLHLWTIEDAKDGDVLVFNNNSIVTFKDLYDKNRCHAYCHFEDDVFLVSEEDASEWWNGEGFKPATKEQRDLLFQKMKEAGYTFDFEKKEVKKIEQPPFEWSEEDEKMFISLHNLIYVVRDCDCDSMRKKEFSDWLKSLKDKYTWKPSKEQMEYLHKYAEQNNYDGAILTSLYNDLKHLKQL